MAYDLTDLELFLQVVDQGSITQGAERAHLSLAPTGAPNSESSPTQWTRLGWSARRCAPTAWS
jgi:hypothetical protein